MKFLITIYILDTVLAGYCILYLWASLCLSIRYFNVNLEEAVQESLDAYRTLGDFFQRELKPTVRQIDTESPLVGSRTSNLYVMSNENMMTYLPPAMI